MHLRLLKTPFYLLLLFTALLFSALHTSAAGGHEIKLKITGLKDTLVYFGYYFGDKQLLQDSARIDHAGNGVIKGDKPLPGGIYLVVLPNKSFFEVLINDQYFTVETDTLDYYEHMKITGSHDNELFRDYQIYMGHAAKELNDLGSRLEKNKGKADSTALLNKQANEIQAQMRDYRVKLMENKDPKLFLPVVIRAFSDADIPEAPKNPDGSTDSTFAFKYFKKHYFDNLDFCDARLIRTPLLYSKTSHYLNSLTYQVPDSIFISLDTILARSKCDTAVFKYVLSTYTSYYELSKIMGFERIFVYLSEKYYLTDQAFWADSTMKAAIRKRVNELKPNLLGEPAYNLLMQDTNYVTQPLYSVKAKYTILAFYDPTCSHCKVEIPKLAHLYDSIKVNGVEVYAAMIEADLKEWKSFIKEQNLKWVNVCDVYGKTRYYDYYDTFIKPIVYVLDENKHILAKRIAVEQIADFIKRDMEKNKK